MKTILLAILTMILAAPMDMDAQHRGRRKGRHVHRHVVVKRSPYRPKKAIVYHPHWGPRHAFHRRWVFFPAWNLYWDNWRNHYVFLNGTVWVSQPTPPPNVTAEELDNSKKKELKEEEDDVDDVYKSIDEHRKD